MTRTLLGAAAVAAVAFATPTLAWHLWPHLWGDPWVSVALADVGVLVALGVEWVTWRPTATHAGREPAGSAP